VNILSKNDKVLKNTGIYGIVSVLQKAIQFFLLPVYTAYLTPKDFGITGVVGSVVSFLSIFYVLSLNGAVTKFYYDYKDDKEKVKELWGTIFLFVLINSLALTSIFTVFHKYLLDPFAKGVSFYPYLLLGLISVTLNPCYSIFQSTLQARQIGKKFGLNNFLYFLVNLSLTLLFVVGFKLKAAGILLALAITDIIFFIYTLIDFTPTIKLKINKPILKKSLDYSLPLLPHSLSGWILAMLDRLFLNNMKSTTDVGIYNTGFQFANIVNILTTAVNQAFVPWFFENAKEGKEGKRRIIKFAEYLSIVFAFVALILSLFGKEVLTLMTSNKDFVEGWKVIPFLSFAYAFNGLYYFFVSPLFYNSKGTRKIPAVTLSNAGLNALLNALFIPKYGIIGAAVASLISMITCSMFILIVSNKIEPIGYHWKTMYAYTFAFFGLSLVNFLYPYTTPINLFIIKLLITFLVMLMIYLTHKRDFKYYTKLAFSKIKK
jgi:O-antigen/teichoic acid export membrane protein